MTKSLPAPSAENQTYRGSGELVICSPMRLQIFVPGRLPFGRAARQIWRFGGITVERHTQMLTLRTLDLWTEPDVLNKRDPGIPCLHPLMSRLNYYENQALEVLCTPYQKLLWG